MDLDYVLGSLTTGTELISPREAENPLPDEPGLYTIFIDDPSNLPEPFFTHLRRRGTNLIYWGKATKSLFGRLFKQDLRHKSPSTFFRAIGPILDYWPPKGSLLGRANKNNYKFSPSDTQAIIGWMNEHLSIRYLAIPAGELSSLEPNAIATLKPLLNTVHNPEALPELACFRDKCRQIALAEQGEAESASGTPN